MTMVKKANNSQPLDISPPKLGHFKRKPITVVEHNWRGVWNKAFKSDFWCNVKFSSSFTTEYKEIWKENLVIYQKSLKAFLQAPLQLSRHFLNWLLFLRKKSR